nr:hypothetical protein [uncultured Comamonas sp.]
MSTKKPTAAGESQGVHTSAQTDPATQAATAATGCTGCGGCAGDCAKPQHHKPTALAPRDKYTGQAGQFIRDPETGERKPATTTEG